MPWMMALAAAAAIAEAAEKAKRQSEFVETHYFLKRIVSVCDYCKTTGAADSTGNCPNCGAPK